MNVTFYYHSQRERERVRSVFILVIDVHMFPVFFVDVYLTGTVMLIFGMGLYDLFVNSLDVPGRKRSPNSSRTTVFGSNLFGLFRLRVKIKSHQNNIHFLILYFPFASQPTTIMFAI